MKRCRFRLNRGQKVLRNFGALLLVLGLIFVLPRAPQWLVEREVRSEAARQGVQTETLWRGVLPCVTFGGEGAPFPGMDSMPTVLAQGGGYLWSGRMGSYEGHVYLSGIYQQHCPSKPALISVHTLDNAMPTEPGVTAILTAVNLPEGTEAGEVSVELTDGQTRMARGKREMEVIHFHIPGEGRWGKERDRLLNQAPYELTLLDETGAVLQKVSGRLPKLEVEE